MKKITLAEIKEMSVYFDHPAVNINKLPGWVKAELFAVMRPNNWHTHRLERERYERLNAIKERELRKASKQTQDKL